MSTQEALDTALDDVDGAGTAEVATDGGRAAVDCAEVGPIGVRVNRLRVNRDRDVDVVGESNDLPGRLRSLGERIRAIEVDAELGGATLRTDPDDIHDREYFELEVRPRHTDLRRVRIDERGDRHDTEFSVTRRQLGRLIDEVTGE